MDREPRTPHESELGSLIRTRRRALGLSQEELAALVGYTQESIGKVERGEVKAPRDAVLIRLADALRIPVSDLFLAMKRADTESEAKRIADSLDVASEANDPLLQIFMANYREMTPAERALMADQAKRLVELRRQYEAEAEKDEKPRRRRNSESD